MRESSFYVYIMSSLSRTLYAGVTNDLERRMAEHKERKRPSSFTARYNVSRLVYFEPLSDINAAIAREKEIKRLTRKRKIKLIESLNPNWKDLSQEWDKAAPIWPGFFARQPRARMTKIEGTGQPESE
jgi:putative endonuclease